MPEVSFMQWARKFVDGQSLPPFHNRENDGAEASQVCVEINDITSNKVKRDGASVEGMEKSPTQSRVQYHAYNY